MNLLKALWSYHHKKTKMPNFPMIEDIEPTNACNFNCPFCVRDRIRERGIGYMSLATFKRIVNAENSHMLRHIQMFMHGEPLLHPNLAHFVSLARYYGKSVGFTTNGQLLTVQKARALLNAGLTDICFSLEGISRETYEKMRVGGNFLTVSENIMNFAKLRRDHYNCQMKIATIDCKETHAEIEQFVNFWREIVDEVIVLPIHDWGGILNSPMIDNSCLEPNNGVCFWPWFALGIYWDGSVAPCCMYEGKADLGNVNDSSIMEIWNSAEYQMFRWCMLHDRDALETCRTCKVNAFTDTYLRTIQKPNPFFPLSWSLINLAKDAIKKQV